MPKKDDVMLALAAAADEHGRVKADTEEMRRSVSMSAHDFTKTLWDWRAQGKLTFREVKAGGQTRVADIVLAGYGNNDKPHGSHTGISAEVVSAIYAVEPDSHGWRAFDANAIRAASGANASQLAHVLRDYRNTAKLEQRGGGKGHSITAVRWIHERPSDVGQLAEAMDDYLGHLNAEVKAAGRTFPITERRIANYTAAEELAAENKFLSFRRDPELDELVALLRIAQEEEGS
jgi:hypothetical protein